MPTKTRKKKTKKQTIEHPEVIINSPIIALYGGAVATYNSDKNVIKLALWGEIDESKSYGVRGLDKRVTVNNTDLLYYALQHEFIHALLWGIVGEKECRGYDYIVDQFTKKGDYFAV